jgi:hypothetical protein
MEDRPPLILSSPVRSGSTTIGPLSLSIVFSLALLISLDLSVLSSLPLSLTLSPLFLSSQAPSLFSGRRRKKKERRIEKKERRPRKREKRRIL